MFIPFLHTAKQAPKPLSKKEQDKQTAIAEAQAALDKLRAEGSADPDEITGDEGSTSEDSEDSEEDNRREQRESRGG